MQPDNETKAEEKGESAKVEQSEDQRTTALKERYAKADTTHKAKNAHMKKPSVTYGKGSRVK